MYIYIAIAVLLAIAIEFSFLRIIDQNLGLFIALTAIASSYLLSWLRWENGADWDAYIKAFNDLNNWDAFIQNSWWEPLYKLISLLVNYFANNYTLFLFIFATILLAAKLYFFCREISWLQFVFVNYCLSISDIFFVRQSVAAWIVAAAIDLFFRKKYIPSLLTALVSFSVHKSSIMCYLVAVLISLFFIESNKRRLLITAIITVSATILFHIIITHVTIEGNRYAIAYFSGDFVDAKASILDGKTRGILKSLAISTKIYYSAFILYKRTCLYHSNDGFCCNSAAFLSSVPEICALYFSFLRLHNFIAIQDFGLKPALCHSNTFDA